VRSTAADTPTPELSELTATNSPTVRAFRPATSESHRELDRVSRRLVQDLHTADPRIFWADLLTCAFVGWVAFAVAIRATLWSFAMLGAVLIAAAALYRGLCFVHEITHIRQRALPGFETAWNLLFGVGLLLPSVTYVGVHLSHHAPAQYGTQEDPEYLPLARSRAMLVSFAIQSSFLLPLLLVLRFALLSPFGWLSPWIRHRLDTHASSFAMNPAYRRSMTPESSTRLRRWEVVLFAFVVFTVVLLSRGVLPVRTLLVWYVVLMIVSLVNTLRVLGAHQYESDGTPGDRTWQLIDSIDTPGPFWTALWAPVGLRYHALHHYFPGIPYHNLGEAYRRIVGTAGRAPATYQQSTSSSLRRSLSALYRKAAQASLPHQS
jgi:fatty acid desaturase